MVRTIKLNDGKLIPLLAFGTGTAGNFGEAQKAEMMATKAIQAGFRHLDTAELYLTEEATGKSVRASGRGKEEIFVCSKLSDNALPATTPEAITKAVKDTVKALGFIPDLFLIHNPMVIEEGKLGEAWKVLEGLVEDGTLKGTSLGVSNFRPQDLEAVMEVAKIKPVVNQCEYHPYVLAHLEPIQAVHDKYGIIFQSYGPLTPLLRHPTGGPLKPILERIADRLSKETGRSVDGHAVLTLWLLSQGIPVVTASGNPDRLQALIDIDSMPDLTHEEVEEITRVGKTIHFRHYREHMETDFPLPDLPSDA